MKHGSGDAFRLSLGDACHEKSAFHSGIGIIHVGVGRVAEKISDVSLVKFRRGHVLLLLGHGLGDGSVHLHLLLIKYGVGLIAVARRGWCLLKEFLGRAGSRSGRLAIGFGFLVTLVIEEVLNRPPFWVVSLLVLEIEPKTACISVVAVRLARRFEIMASGTIIAVPKTLDVSLGDANVKGLGSALDSVRRFTIGWKFVFTVKVGMRISVLFNMSIILPILTGTESVRGTKDSKNGILVPAIGFHHSDNAPSLDDIAVAGGNEGFIGSLGIPDEGAEAPAEIKLGTESARHIVEDALAELSELPFESLAMEGLVGSLALRIADVPVEDRSGVLDEPLHNRLVDRDLSIEMGFEG